MALLNDDLEVAISRVKKAAAKFGKAQETATDDWLDKAISLDPKAARDAESLIAKQLVLFEQCLVDDEDGKCRELDAALTSFEANLGKAKGTFLDRTQFDRAAARVRSAASKFGTEQKKSADEWVKRSRLVGAVDSASLMEQQVSLFGECMLDGDTAKCQQLDEALTAFRVALGVEEPAEDVQVSSGDTEANVEAEEAPTQASAQVAATEIPPAAPPTPKKPEAKVDTSGQPPSIEALKTALRQATAGRDRGTKSTLAVLERAIESAQAAGVDADALSVAREVLERKGKGPNDPSTQFW